MYTAAHNKANPADAPKARAADLRRYKALESIQAKEQFGEGANPKHRKYESLDKLFQEH